MKLLLTGANGQLGQEIIRQFHKYELVVIDHTNLDITNYITLEAMIFKIQPDVDLALACNKVGSKFVPH